MLQLKIPRAETKTQHSQINIKKKKKIKPTQKKEPILRESIIPTPRYLFHKYSPTIAKIYANIF